MSENKVIKTFRAGTISATVWEKEIKDRLDHIIKIKSFNLQRGFKRKGSDKFENQNINLNNIGELRKVILCLNKAEEFVSLKEED